MPYATRNWPYFKKWLDNSRSLDGYLQNRQRNNFHLIRLISAVLVVLTHCCELNDPLFKLSGGFLLSSTLAMPAFFFLSGLLIAQSRDHSPSIASFLWKRFLRLYPAAVAVILICACIIGPLITTLPLHSYFSDPLFFQYLQTCLLIHNYSSLPGVFTHSIIGNAVNVSLWSLGLELKLYVFLLLVSLLPKKIYLPLITIFIVLLFTTGTFFYAAAEAKLQSLLSPDLILQPYTEFVLYFLMGMLAYYCRRLIIIHDYWLLLLVLAWWLSSHFQLRGPTAFLLPLSVLYLATSGASWTHRITPKPDLSYGIYVWAYPIEQLVINYLYPKTTFFTFFLTLLFTLPFAFFSWYVIEKPSLKAKHLIK